jgi:hypothetical protein
VKGEKVDLVTSGRKELRTGCTAHGRNFVIRAERLETGRNLDLKLGRLQMRHARTHTYTHTYIWKLPGSCFLPWT